MRRIVQEHLFDIIAIQQMLYDYCHELDAGAHKVTDYFTEDCLFYIGESVWHGHTGLTEHYDADKRTVAEQCKDGLRTIRHVAVNPRTDVHDDGTATVDFIFLNFSAQGHAPFVHASSPTVVADTRLELKRGPDGQWRIHEFYGKPLFFGEDPFMNNVLMDL